MKCENCREYEATTTIGCKICKAASSLCLFCYKKEADGLLEEHVHQFHTPVDLV